MGLNLTSYDGQTPLEEDERDGLLIETISTREELDEFEQQNIEEAMIWLRGQTMDRDQVLSSAFVRDLHQQMFGLVWSWAGTFRATNKNLGVDKHQVATRLESLCGDARYWVECESFSPDELAIRFKHLIVSIHCFANGNGRHSRLMADVIIEKIFGLDVFSWGAKGLSKTDDMRASYLNALRKADAGDYTNLLAFARS